MYTTKVKPTGQGWVPVPHIDSGPRLSEKQAQHFKHKNYYVNLQTKDHALTNDYMFHTD